MMALPERATAMQYDAARIVLAADQRLIASPWNQHASYDFGHRHAPCLVDP
jgi:hypothetical protein